jgi:hypothetical protein
MSFGLLELGEVARAQRSGINGAGLERQQTRLSKANRDVNDRIGIDTMLAEQQTNRKFLSVTAARYADFFANDILQSSDLGLTRP